MSARSHEKESVAPAVTSPLILTIVAASAIMALDALTPLGLAVWVLQVVLVWIASLWASPRQMITVAILCSTYIVLAHWLSPSDGTTRWVGVTNLLLGLAAVAAITHTCLRQRATEQARRKAASELARSQATVRILRGLLPVCAWCKRIRNDGGAWEQMETYIRNHSQADFTHGMCEECALRLHEEPAPSAVPE
jgi:hypothetical protein